VNTPAAAPPRQINLYDRSLLPTRERFSARQIALGIGAASLAMAAIAWWAAGEAATLRREVAEQAKQLELEAALALAPPQLGGRVVPTPEQVAALEKALGDKQALLDTRLAAREALKRGMAGPGSGPSAIMRTIAESVPRAAWLTGVRVVGARIDLTGRTIDAAAVEGWLDGLRASGFLAESPAPTVQVERLDPATTPARSAHAYLFTISAELSAPLADEGAEP
jgi:Tfp pilus assembly protein PilN